MSPAEIGMFVVKVDYWLDYNSVLVDSEVSVIGTFSKEKAPSLNILKTTAKFRWHIYFYHGTSSIQSGVKNMMQDDENQNCIEWWSLKNKKQKQVYLLKCIWTRFLASADNCSNKVEGCNKITRLGCDYMYLPFRSLHKNHFALCNGGWSEKWCRIYLTSYTQPK